MGRRKATPSGKLKDVLNAVLNADWGETKPLDLPIVAFYDTDRAVFDPPQRRTGFRTEFSRYGALQGALSGRTDFRDFFEWFHAKEDEELREQKEHQDFNYRLNDLEAVRKAIEAMLPGISNPRIKLSPLRFVVAVQSDDGKSEELSIDQLSGGYRIVLALAADLARRMAQGNPHLEDPLQSEAVVLIDEIELHLHPSWQQRVLADLRRPSPTPSSSCPPTAPRCSQPSNRNTLSSWGGSKVKLWQGLLVPPLMGQKRGTCWRRSWGWRSGRQGMSL